MNRVKERTASIVRTTKETDVRIALNLDGKGDADIATGIPFFDHMLILVAAHGLFDLSVQAKGDVEVDLHHTVEDVGLVLGQAFNEAAGDKTALHRYGQAVVPMDEALASVAIDFSNRSFLSFNVPFSTPSISGFDTQLPKEFFRAFSQQGGFTIHVHVVSGENNHHIIEAVFKAFGRALDQATLIDPRIKGIQSTKGVL